MGRRAALEINANVEPSAPPEESGGDGSASLFDTTSDARVRVLRRDDTTQKFVTHGYLPPDANEEMVNALFGGGFYKGQLVVPDPATGKLQIKRTRDFRIPGAYKPPQKINDFADAMNANGSAASPLVTVSPASAQGLPSTGELMQALNAGVISSVIDLLKSMREVKTIAPPVGPDPMMMKLMETQGALQLKILEILMTRGNDGDATRKTVMAELVQMKEIFASSNGAVPTDPMKMFNNMLETFKSFKDAAAEVAPEPSDVDPIMGSIPKLVEVIAEQHQMSKNRVVRSAPMPTGGAPVAPEVGTLPPQPDLAIWQKILRQQSSRLMVSATAKHDPDVIAGTAILFATPPIREALQIFFHRDETAIMADVLTEIPAMVEHREWLGEFIQCAQERLFPEEFAEDDDPIEKEGEEGGAS